MARIGIDIRKYADFGIGTYIRRLVDALGKRGDGHSYVLLHAPDFNTDLAPEGFETVEERAGLYSVTEPFALGRAARHLKLDLLHCPHYVTPMLCPCPVAVTIHDLIHLRYPEYLSGLPARMYARYFLRRAARRARIIFTVSETSKRDILTYLPAVESQIMVTPNGVEEAFHPHHDQSAVADLLNEYNVDGPYVLYVGNNKPHKNLDTAMDAFRQFRNSVGRQWRLVLAGGVMQDPKAGAALLNRIEESKLSDCVILAGYLPLDKLALLYHGASLFLFPSRYEGFGLPPLEAMASGVPVVSSDKGALPEVLGSAAQYADPEDAMLISMKMREVVVDDDKRETMITSGLQRAAQYSWDVTAAHTLAGYRQALEQA